MSFVEACGIVGFFCAAMSRLYVDVLFEGSEIWTSDATFPKASNNSKTEIQKMSPSESLNCE
jgi:hypothetical protein